MEITERISDVGASEKALQTLENRLDARIPNDYRIFLRTINGGRPRPRDFDTLDGEEGSRVQFFFTLDENASHYVILKELETFADRIPEKTLPIACDSFGNLVLLDVGARSHGAVYFWDHENESMEGNAYWQNVYPVAASFTKFLQALK